MVKKTAENAIAHRLRSTPTTVVALPPCCIGRYAFHSEAERRVRHSVDRLCRRATAGLSSAVSHRSVDGTSSSRLGGDNRAPEEADSTPRSASRVCIFSVGGAASGASSVRRSRYMKMVDHRADGKVRVRAMSSMRRRCRRDPFDRRNDVVIDGCRAGAGHGTRASTCERRRVVARGGGALSCDEELYTAGSPPLRTTLMKRSMPAAASARRSFVAGKRGSRVVSSARRRTSSPSTFSTAVPPRAGAPRSVFLSQRLQPPAQQPRGAD